MKQLRLYQIDSFTTEKFRGNPAGVVANADGLTPDQMLRIAREMNNSETAFIFETPGDGYDVEVRFFTPTTEVPICGHATIAAHYVRAMERGMEKGRVVQKTKAGNLPVDVEKIPGGYNIVMTQGAISISDPLPEETQGRILNALGIPAEEHRADCPMEIASTGHGKVMIGITSLDRLHSLQPNLQQLIAISREIGCNGYYIFTLHPGEEILAHGRMFGPAAGIPEDPVTGNANGPLGAYLVHHRLCGAPEEGLFSFTARQGEAIGRTGDINVYVDVENAQPKLVRIAGNAVSVFKAELEIED